MMSGTYRHLFGPVRSRRLGLSLGLDLVPPKVCSFNCPYCQIGATTSKTLERREYVPVDEVLVEFDRWLAADGRADCVTLAGSGEPTLHSRFGDVLKGVASRCGFKRVLLSNGSLFSLPEVRAAAATADIVKGTLSAWDAESFNAVHHPHRSLVFSDFVDGLIAMRKAFGGEYWLEVFIVPGRNDSDAQVRKIAELARAITPDHIHLNTAVRPSADVTVQAVSHARLAELAALFTPIAEVAASGRPADGASGGHTVGDLAERLCALAARHPATATDMAAALGVGVHAARSLLDQLVSEDRLKVDQRDGAIFYASATPAAGSDGR